MAERDVTVALSSDTSGFSEGIQQAKKILLELNKTLVDSQSTLKAATQELNTYEKEQKKLQEEMSKSGNDTEENRKKMALLTEKIKEQKEKVAQLRTEQTEIRGQISRATTALKNETNAVEEAAKKNNNLSGAVSETSEELKKQGQEAENASEGFTVLKGAISNLVSDALRVAIDEFKEMSVSAEQSLNSLQVKTGMSAEAVGELKDEMYDIYKNNFGDSLTDVADKMALVAQNIDESDPSKLKDITEKAIGLSDAFGSDFEENLRGVNGLMTNMGLTADEAFDLIAKGSQNGLDKTHELTDNLAEYSQLWGQAGFSAQEMFSILQNGLDSGAYTLDKVNDYVGEFGKALADGRMAESITNFSIETQNLFTAWKNGGATTADIFKSAISDLSNMANQQKALTIATETWGSLGEDNAMSVITALNNVNNTYNDVAGTMQEINDIQYDDVGSQIEALGRQFEVDILQPIVEGITPATKDIISWTSDHLPEVTSTLAGLVTTVVTFKTATAAGSFLNGIINGFKQLSPAIKVATAEQATNNAVTAANPYIAVASAVLGLVSALTTWIATSNNATQATTDNTQSLKDYSQAMRDAKSSVEDSEAQAASEIALINSQKERYDELRKKVNLTAQEKNELNNIASSLAKTIGTTTSNLKDENGALKDVTKSVEDYTTQLKNKLLLESSENVLKEAYQITEFDITQEDVDAALKSYNEYADKLWEQIRNSSKYHDYARAGKVYNRADALHSEEMVKFIGGDYNQLKALENQWGNLQYQRFQALQTIEEYNKKVEKLRGNLNDENGELDKTSNSLEKTNTKTEQVTQATQNLAKTMSELSARANVVTKAEEEYNESERFTVSTIQAVIDKYPELESKVFDYMAGLTDAKSLIESMKSTYDDDAEAFFKAQINKNGNNADFYKNVMLANTDWVNDCKEKYNIDLRNYSTWAQARNNIMSGIIKQVSALPGMGQLLGSVLTSAQDSWFDSILSQFTSRFITAKGNPFSLENMRGNSDDGGSGGGSGGSNSDKDNKYELASEAYNHLVDKRIEKIEKEAEAAEKAKDRKIAAIDAEIEARKRLNEDADRQAELDEINARLEYDQLSKLDRRELERKRQNLLNEQTQVEWERMMSDRKNSIQNGYDSQKDSYSQAIDSLQRAAISAENYFSRLAGTQTSSQIVNNNSDTRNIQIIANALSDQQMLDKLLNALYSK